MRKKVLILGFLSVFVAGGCTTTAGLAPFAPVHERASTDDDANQYDYWLNSISKPGHLYLHYNRGSDTNYQKYCLWLWQSMPQDLEGALWGYSANPVVSTNLTLQPMSTSWMQKSDVGKSGSGIYYDDYGAIMDVDLCKTGLVGGKTGKATTYWADEVANPGTPEKPSEAIGEELGFLLVLQSSMDGSTNWTSDGDRETYIDDISVKENWRVINGGETIHIFVSKGQLSNYKYFAGDGVPEVKVNPIDSDTTGKYSSTIDPEYKDVFDVSTTSESFKKLGIGYQIFVASFRDSNKDGIGDIRGIINSLEYLKSLGTDVIWLTPIQKSDSYHGYDISDYLAVDKRFGTIEDYRELIYKAHKMGMKVIMDLVLNHTSKGNQWYINSQWGVNDDGSKNEWRDVYTWKFKTDSIQKYNHNTGQYDTITVEQDARSDNPSWYKSGESDYYYYGKFGSGMPEINYQNKKTRELVIKMAKYWLSFGLDGYRLDAIKHIFMRDECYQPGDQIITDVGEKTAYDDEKGQYITKSFDYSSNLTKNVTWWKEFANSLKADYPNCFLVGENFDGWGTRTAPYYQALDSQFSFSTYYHIASQIYGYNGAGSWADKQAGETFVPFAGEGPYELDNVTPSIWVSGGKRPDFIDGAFTSNHDVMRAINQVNGEKIIVDGQYRGETKALNKVTGAGDQVNKAKIHAAITLLNRGISWIYYGDELGMSSNTDKHIDIYKNENCEDIWYRQPFLWKDTSVRANYKSGQYKFELDDYNKTLLSMEDQAEQSNSMLNWYKGLSEIKHAYPADARISFINGGNVLGIRVDDKNGQCQLIIYIQLGTGQSEWSMNPDYHAGRSMVPFKQLGGAPATGDIGSHKFSIAAFKAA